MLKYSVGLDISSKKIDCCFSSIDMGQKVTVQSTVTVSNNPSGFNLLADCIDKNHRQKDITLVICMEAILFIPELIKLKGDGTALPYPPTYLNKKYWK